MKFAKDAKGAVENKKAKLTGEQKKKLAIVITAAVLFVAICVSCVFLLIIPMVKRDKNFDYHKSDLSKYISLPEEVYKNYSMSLNISKPRDIDVDIATLSMVTADKSKQPLYEGALQRDVAITAGDIVNIYYRGYIIQDGRQKTVVSNLANDTYTSFEIGGCAFPSPNYPVRGVENALLGIVPSEHTKFERIKDGDVKENYIVYVTFERYPTSDEKKSESGKKERIDLEGETLESVYGKGFKEALVGKPIGAEINKFTSVIEGVEYTYKNIKVDFATECEKSDKVVRVEGYYPYHTGSTVLNNKDVTFEIYVQSTQVYETPEFNDEYIAKKVAEVDSGVRMDELLEYEGESLVEKYRAYAKAYLYEQYEAELRSQIEDNIWSHYNNKVEIKRVPGIKVDEIYYEYYSEVSKAFEESGGVVYNKNTEETETYDNLSDYAKVYLGLWNATDDWTVLVRELAEDLVVERIVLYYIMYAENIAPTESELAAKVEKIREEYMDEYIYQYLSDFQANRADFEASTKKENVEYVAKMDRIILAWKTNDTANAEYVEFVREREAEMFDYYDDNYFIEMAYYEIVMDVVVTWPEVTTLDTPAIK
jgi:FKBP-type peptidyl-prolyl cis-trans isomerase (trigger factor)